MYMYSWLAMFGFLFKTDFKTTHKPYCSFPIRHCRPHSPARRHSSASWRHTCQRRTGTRAQCMCSSARHRTVPLCDRQTSTKVLMKIHIRVINTLVCSVYMSRNVLHVGTCGAFRHTCMYLILSPSQLRTPSQISGG